MIYTGEELRFKRAVLSIKHETVSSKFIKGRNGVVWTF